jgi:sortase A
MKKTFIALVVALITIIAITVFTRTIVSAAVYDPSTFAAAAAVATSAKNRSTIPPGYPLRLAIPSLGVNAAVQEVGITVKGNIGTPNNFVDVAWYSYGTIPGQPGNAIIDGHVDNGLSLPGVFKNLQKITTGSNIYVTTYGGKKLSFIVTGVQSYDYENFPSDQIFNSAKTSSDLTLITCTGTWVPDNKTYNQRLVVTAKLVG